MYEENKQAMIDVLREDLRRSKFEAVLLEVDFSMNDLVNTLHYLDEWVKPERVSCQISHRANASPLRVMPHALRCAARAHVPVHCDVMT